MEVLRLLAAGLPPVAVAKKFFLSPFTVKAHTQNIYSKLDVHSRIEAINKARAAFNLGRRSKVILQKYAPGGVPAAPFGYASRRTAARAT